MNWTITTGTQTDPGCVRELNEDSCCIVQPGDADTRDRRGVLSILADGMGGHAAGEVASALAVETVRARYYADGSDAPDQALRAAFAGANAAIYEESERRPGAGGMGTTCVALAIHGGLASVASVGDSRLYLIRAGGIYRMTVDDSAVTDLVRQGLISAEEARHRDDRNVLLRALGTHEHVDVYSWDEPFPVRLGDAFVLCSDGLSDLVSDDEILQRVTADGVNGCRELVETARARGGYDNITVIVLCIEEARQPSTQVPITREVPLA